MRFQPADVATLTATLDPLGYLTTQADLDAVAPYLARGYYVVAVRVAIEGARTDSGLSLEPLQLTWAGTELRLPVALGGSTSDGLVVYVAADGRYDFADSTVTFARDTSSHGATFVTRNILPPTAPSSPDDDPVALHVPGDPEHQERVVTEEMVRVPVEDCDLDFSCGFGCRECSAGGARGDIGAVVVAVAFVLLPRRRRRAGWHARLNDEERRRAVRDPHDEDR